MDVSDEKLCLTCEAAGDLNSAEQSRATGAAGTIGDSAALLSQDANGRVVPIPGRTNPGAPKGNRNAWKHGASAVDLLTLSDWIFRS